MWPAALSLLLASAAPVHATFAQPANPVASQPPGRNALGFFVGDWSVVAVDPTNGDELRLCYAVRPFVADKWLSGSGTSDEPGFEARDVWGHDPVSSEVVRTIFDGSGTYAVVRSRGWTGGTLILEGDALSTGGSVRVRETIKQLGRNEF
jgi:hypothetical protein